MWVKYKGTPYPAEQSDILDYMTSAYPYPYWDYNGYGGSLGAEGIEQALFDYSGIQTDPISVSIYSGDSEVRPEVAAIKKGLLLGNPTIMITNHGQHSKIVIGGSWTQLTSWQPQIDYITTADPADYGPRSDQLANWVTNVGNLDELGSLLAIQVLGQKGSAGGELDAFDYWGGTYYGEEDPPDGCDNCQPLEETTSLGWLRALAAFFRPPQIRLNRSSIGSLSTTVSLVSREEAQAPQQPPITNRRRHVGPQVLRNHSVRRFIYVPKPHATDPGDIVKNLMAGFDQMHLKNAPDWQDLDNLIKGNQLRVSSIVHVDSLTGAPEYWLLTLEANGAKFAQALVSETGWLLSVMRAPIGVVIDEPRSLDWAQAVASEMGYAKPEIRRVHMVNNLTRRSGSADYDPFFEVTSTGHAAAYLAQDGRAYRVDTQGTGIAYWKDGERRLTRIR
jgi:hypothetical protein